MSTILSVIATTTIPGVHSWPGAPPKMVFLKYPHRHLFHVKVEAFVDHAEREIEIITLKNWIKEFFLLHYPKEDFGTDSCESICLKLRSYFCAVHGVDVSYVEVMEDGENGASLKTNTEG